MIGFEFLVILNDEMQNIFMVVLYKTSPEIYPAVVTWKMYVWSELESGLF